MILLDLFLGFLRVGCFSFGGAYGAIPLIRDVVMSYGWLDEETLIYFIAVSESTPGPIMVNLATYVGSSQAGLAGAVVATLAVVLPAFVIILLVMAVFKKLLRYRGVQAALSGVKPCVIGIILATGIYMIVDNVAAVAFPVLEYDRQAGLVTAFLLAVVLGARKGFGKEISTVWLIVISAVLGVIVYSLFP